ncbi:MAG: formate dehydrogenase accessory sulfurtransferase FdhD [Nitrososphaerota archaeon]|nr:formate dehydrogenase accessory sulfurtransferase FdhD [Candidatus Bathyarchaeota archaeon]MDW8048178.1 formate dehydrogenase accessory sulfurtransferase FdhD [Nitrososphaerota archaeon]
MIRDGLTAKLQIIRVNYSGAEASFERMMDYVAVEEEISVYFGGKFYRVFSFTPGKLVELVIGHLLAEGIIGKPDDVLEIEIVEDKVDVKFADVSKRAVSIPELREIFRPLAPMVKPEIIMESMEELCSRSTIYSMTGGTHAAGIISLDGEIMAFAEDVGRHNAVDKAVGEAALLGIDFGKMFLALTCRLSSKVVLKAVQVGVPLIASISAPTGLGVKLADSAGVTLIGFVRDGRMNVYSHPWRVIGLA